MRKTILYLLTLSVFCGGFAYRSTAQVYDEISQKLYSIVEDYLSIYQTIESNYPVDISKFKSLFVDGETIIDNDFFIDPGFTLERFPNAGVYINHLVTLFQSKPYPQISDFTAEYLPTAQREIMFCRGNDVFHAWVYKKINYKINGQLRKVYTWVHLKIIQLKKEYKIASITVEAEPTDPDRDKVPDITIDGMVCDACAATQTGAGKFVLIKGCLNTDQDEDGVEDKIDRCPTEKGSIRTGGCPDSDADGTKNGNDKCPYDNGPGSNSGCPISELTFSIAAGGLLPFGTPYSGKTVLDNQTYQWSNGGNLARTGLLFGFALEYHFSTWLGLGAGGMNFSNPIDKDRLRLNIEAYLANNNLPYNDVTVASHAYQYNMAYFKLSMGNFKSNVHQFKIEPVIGEAFNGFAKNEMIIHVNYQTEGDKVNVVSFKTKPFLLYGSSLKYEMNLPELPLVLVAQAWYLTGTPEFEEQTVSFSNNPSALQFSSRRIQVTGASLGVQFSLSKGEEYYKNRF